jgi:hypothetical protein
MFPLSHICPKFFRGDSFNENTTESWLEVFDVLFPTLPCFSALQGIFIFKVIYQDDQISS